MKRPAAAASPMARAYPSFWMDALLVVVTLGFYMPWWLWRRNRDLSEDHPAFGLQDNLPFLAGGLLVSLVGTATGLLELPFLGSALVIAGILVFAAGVFILLRNGETAAEATRTLWRVPPAMGAGLFAAAFAAVEVGNTLPTYLVRGPALLLLASLPFVFYYVHEDLGALAAEPAPVGAVTS